MRLYRGELAEWEDPWGNKHRATTVVASIDCELLKETSTEDNGYFEYEARVAREVRDSRREFVEIRSHDGGGGHWVHDGVWYCQKFTRIDRPVWPSGMAAFSTLKKS